MMLIWWHWIVAGLALAGLEALVPGYIFLGFSVGAVATGLLVARFGVFAGLPLLLLIFALLSLAAWLMLRRLLPGRRGAEGLAPRHQRQLTLGATRRERQCTFFGPKKLRGECAARRRGAEPLDPDLAPGAAVCRPSASKFAGSSQRCEPRLQRRPLPVEDREPGGVAVAALDHRRLPERALVGEAQPFRRRRELGAFRASHFHS